MGQNIKITDFGPKLELALRRSKSPVRSRAELLKAIPTLTSDYFTRLINGQRPLSEQAFIDISTALDIEEREWFTDLLGFGIKLGFSRHQIAEISGALPPGLDFQARNRDQIHTLFDQMKGYWESYYYSVSNMSRKAISRDLLIVKDVTADLFIACEIVDGQSTYVGHCFPIKGGHLCFILEKVQPTNEIIMYSTNYPERHPPVLNGIILCLSGGVGQTLKTCPAAAKVAFRYLGSEAESIRKVYRKVPRNASPELVERTLRKVVPGYVYPDELSEDDRQWETIRMIDNTILMETLPFALRMEF